MKGPISLPAPLTSWTTSGRAVDFLATAVGAACAMVVVVLLASMGVDAADPTGPSGRSMLIKGLAAILSLAAAFALGVQRLRREKVRQARGRVLVVGGREAGFKSAIGLALGALALGLMLMAGLEVGASALASEEGASGSTDGESALEKAREGRNAFNSDAETSGGQSSGRTAAAGLVGPGQHSGQTSQRTQGVRLGDLLSDEPILRAASTAPLPTPTVHLRGLVLDRYGRGGTLQERQARVPAAFAASGDGWIDVPRDGARRGSATNIELGIELLAPANGVVFAPATLQSIGAQKATYDRSSELWTIVPESTARYSVRSAWPSLSVAELSGRMARGSVTGSISLPSGARGSDRLFALRSLAAYAESLSAGCSSELEEVIAIVSHLRNAFGYELFDVGMLGPEGCLGLIERGSGSCTHFASLAALLLRSRQIPTRIAVGYVAREELPREEGPGWLVRARDGHAWIEVHFDGFGWLPFDPTPGDPTAGGASTGWTPLDESEPSVSQWLDTAGGGGGTRSARTSALGEWVAGALTGMFRWLGDRAADVQRSVTGNGPWPELRAGWAIGLIAAAVLAVWGLRRRRRMIAPAEDGSEEFHREGPQPALGHDVPLATLPAARDLMAALTERGLVQRLDATPSGFAREVESKHPESAGLTALVRTLLGRASTRAPLTKVETQRLEQLTGRIRAGSEPESGERDPSGPRP